MSKFKNLSIDMINEGASPTILTPEAIVKDKLHKGIKLSESDLPLAPPETLKKQAEIEVQLDSLIKSIKYLEKNVYQERGKDPTVYYEKLAKYHDDIEWLLLKMPFKSPQNKELGHLLLEVMPVTIFSEKNKNIIDAANKVDTLKYFDAAELIDIIPGLPASMKDLLINKRELTLGLVNGIGTSIDDTTNLLKYISKDPLGFLEQLKNITIDIDGNALSLYDFFVNETTKLISRSVDNDMANFPYDFGYLVGRLLIDMMLALSGAPEASVLTLGANGSLKTATLIKAATKPSLATLAIPIGSDFIGSLTTIGGKNINIEFALLLNEIDYFKLSEMLKLQFPVHTPILVREWSKEILYSLINKKERLSSLTEQEYKDTLMTLKAINELISNPKPGFYLTSNISMSRPLKELLMNSLKASCAQAIPEDDPERMRIMEIL